MIILQTQGLGVRFGGLVANHDITLGLPIGARHALIGPNGAGKTTFINLLTGVLRPTSGSIHLGGTEITNLRADRRAGLGLVRTFQINQLFPALTPIQSVALAVARRRGQDTRFWQRMGRQPAIIDEAVDILSRFGLLDVLDRPTAELPYGRQRLLEIALAIACAPRVLLLDEPAAGVPEGEREAILQAVAGLPAEVAVLLIEHDMDLVFRFARHILVLVGGELLTQGPPDAIAADPRVRAVYLGEAHG
jgi:ABC-type branched-subunit amino acid transport system ATPase component